MAKRELKRNNVVTEESTNLGETNVVEIGVVNDCSKLNIRKSPKLTADVLEVVNVGLELEIDRSKSTKEWFKVGTNSGTEGFCMKKYVTIKENSNGEHTDID